jgi:HD-GYP domain-containing protein (c-di-GMP phosphodiesterase class II)
LKLADTLGWNTDRVQRVGLAALIHEIGVTRLPIGLTYNESTLGSDELSRLRRRPGFSAELLGGTPSEYEWLAAVVGQVYEREDGSGSPLGLKSNEISEEAKVIGLADFFESCIHKRPYRAPLTGYQTLFELTTSHAACFSDRMVKALIKSFSLYPYNECVVLDNGEIGRVIDINPEKLSRPIVDILFDDQDTLTVEPRTVDLAVESERYISKAISLQALPF